MQNDSFEIRIYEESQPRWFIGIVLAIAMCSGILIDVFALPNAIKYGIDVFVALLFALAVANLRSGSLFVIRHEAALGLWILLFFCLSLIVYLFHYQSILYFLWGMRNNFRFYVFFFACTLFLNKRHIDAALKIFDAVFFINVTICFIQYFAFGLRGDFLGGIFGIRQGCNGYLNIFQCLIVAKALLFYLRGREGFGQCLLKLGLSLLVAALAELKFYYAEFIVIVILAIVITRMSLRKVGILLGCILIIPIAVSVLEKIYPHFAGFLSMDYFLTTAASDGYSAPGELNRLTALPMISETILTTNTERLFGLGLGNCDTSAFSFLETPFHFQFSSFKYTWFSTAFLFLETGYLGLFFYSSFFIWVGIQSLVISKKVGDNGIYCQISLILSLICLMVTVYNSSMRTEAAYMIYFMLAFPLILEKEAWLEEM